MSPDLEESEIDRLDRNISMERRDEGGLNITQREQLDRLLIEAGDDPQIRAALSAMFYIGLHQDNSLEMHIIAHREALREDMQRMMAQIEGRANDQIMTLRDVISRLDTADETRISRFLDMERFQDAMGHELHQQRITIRALTWIVWGMVALFIIAVIAILIVILS
jgi:hypothetical protein